MTVEVKEFLNRSLVIRYMDDYVIQLLKDIQEIIPSNINCIDEYDMTILSDIIQKGIDTCLTGAAGTVSEWRGQTDNIPDEYIAEAYVYSGNMIWDRFVDLFNMTKYPATNTNNGENYLTLDHLGFVFCMMGLDASQRRIFIPAIEDILIEAFDSAMSEAHEIHSSPSEAWTPNSDNKVPPSGQYELRNKIFEDSGISELLRLFEKIGTYHPDGKYDEDWKTEYHNRIETLMDQLFKGEINKTITIKVGNIITFGKRHDTCDPIEWIVAHVTKEGYGILVTKDTYASMMFDAPEPNNPIEGRKNYGNNRWSVSNIRQWLNSDKPANEWFVKQHEYDTAPDYSDQNGFLYNFSEEEKSLIVPKKNLQVVPSIDEDGSHDVTIDSVWLPSVTEYFGSSNNGIMEGEQFEWFKTQENRNHDNVFNNAWERSAYVGNTSIVSCLHSDGSSYSYWGAYGHPGIRPAIMIKSI